MSDKPSQQAPHDDSHAQNEKTESKNIKGLKTKREVGKRNISGTFGTLFTIAAFSVHNWVFWGFLILSLSCLAYCLHLELKHLGYTKTPARSWAAILFSVGLLLGLAYWLGSERIQPLPSLEPMLVIDSVSGRNVLYHYEITNTGKAKAVLTMVSDIGDGHWERDLGLFAKELNPNATIEAPFYAHETEMPNFLFRRTLLLSYHGDSSHDIRQRFRFSIFRDVLKAGAYHYDSSEDDSGSEVNLSREMQSALGSPTGGIAFGFTEKNKNGIPLKAATLNFDTNHFRLFVIDVPAQSVRFLSIAPLGHVSDLAVHLNTNNGLHTLMFSWDGSGAMLGVDGQGISDPTNFGMAQPSK